MLLVSGVKPDLKYLEGGSALYTALSEDGHTLDMTAVMNQVKRGQLNVAVIGGLRSGKSTLAEILEKEYGMKRLSFGAKLKEVVAEAVKYTPLAGKKNVPLLQTIGQQFRQFHEDVWVSHVNQTFIEGDCTGFVIDDLRQPNEYLWALNNGFLIVRVHASEDIRYERAIEAGDVITREHMKAETESYYEHYPVHFEVPNEGSLDHFKLCMWDIFEPILVTYQDYHTNTRVIEIMDKLLKESISLCEKSFAGSTWATDFQTSYSIAKESLLPSHEASNKEKEEGELKLLVIESYYELGMSYSEISVPLGVSTWRVRKLRNKALIEMWEHFDDYVKEAIESHDMFQKKRSKLVSYKEERPHDEG